MEGDADVTTFEHTVRNSMWTLSAVLLNLPQAALILRWLMNRPSVAKSLKCGGDSKNIERSAKEGTADGENSTPTFVPISLCTISLATSLVAVLIVPVTLLLQASSGHSFRFWIPFMVNEEVERSELALILNEMWGHILVVANICLFIVLPFAYFYTEAVGVLQFKGRFSRALESAIVLALFLVVMRGLYFTLHLLLGVEDDIASLQRPLSFDVTSATGALCYLVVAPLGFRSIVRWCFAMRRPRVDVNKVHEEIDALRFDLRSLDQNIQRAEGGSPLQTPEKPRALSSLRSRRQRPGPSPSELAALRNAREDTAESITMRERELASASRYGNAIFLCLAVVVLALVALVGIRLIDRQMGGFPFGHTFMEAVCAFCFYPAVVAAIDVALVLFFMLCSVLGLWEWRITMRIFHKTSAPDIQSTLFTTSVFIIMSLALPIVIWATGLAALDLHTLYRSAAWIESDGIVHVYTSLLFIALTVEMLSSPLFEHAKISRQWKLAVLAIPMATYVVYRARSLL